LNIYKFENIIILLNYNIIQIKKYHLNNNNITKNNDIDNNNNNILISISTNIPLAYNNIQ